MTKDIASVLAELKAKVQRSAIQIIGKGSFRKVELVNVGTWKQSEQPIDEWKDWNIGWTVVDFYQLLEAIAEAEPSNTEERTA